MSPSEKIKVASDAMTAAVRGAIAQSELTQIEVSDLSYITINTLSRRLTGKSPFTWPEIAAIAEVTGVSVADLAVSADRIAARKVA